MTEVARRYFFRGRHYVPSLPPPWCEPHEHDYTIEVVARGVPPIVVDTDALDRAWEALRSHYVNAAAYAPDSTTVEALAEHWLAAFRERFPAVRRVVVWEDDSRWGAAE